MDLINVEGWIPREQILGAEAWSKVPAVSWWEGTIRGIGGEWNGFNGRGMGRGRKEGWGGDR